MSASVVDTSAIMAYLNQEAGQDVVDEWLDRGVAVSALGIQETMSNLVRTNVERSAATEAITALGLTVHDLNESLAIEAGAMISVTRSKGLSHGDRACLALAKLLGVPAVTADRPWKELADDLGVEVVLIR